MTTESSLLGLSGDDWWGDFDPIARPGIMARIMAGEDLLGLTVDAPPFIPLEQKDRLPLVGYHIRTLREDQQVNAEKQALCVMSCAESGALRYGLALHTGRNSPPDLPPSDDDPGDGLCVSGFEVDLRTQLDVPWEPGTWRLVMLLRERVSNPVTVELGPGHAAFRDEAVEAWLQRYHRERQFPPPPPVHPALVDDAALPSYQPLAQTPAVPDSAGINLTMDRVVVDRGQDRWMVRGAFRLPLHRRFRVEVDPETGERPDVGDEEASAVIPIVLLATGSDAPGPFEVPLAVPSYDPLPDDHYAEHDVTGVFNLDLRAMAEMPRRPMTYFFVAISGSILSESVPMGVVDPARLR